METDRHKTEDEYGMLVKQLLEHEGLSFEDVKGIIVSSVVPPIMFALERMCEKYFKIKPLVVGPGIKTGLNIKYENPREVGADRIVNAVAGITYMEVRLLLSILVRLLHIVILTKKSIIWVELLHREL